MGASSSFIAGGTGAGGLSILREIRTERRGDSLPLGVGTLGGDTLGAFQGEGIGEQ